ncbi:MAG: TIGR04076 family protein [Dysgonamonadaceae bacterium]|jgi:uncharacterized repeat protein (TIGR04076 family)|nr:TIGR04076 family protein [Dysgonamonadaceae bacterium]
MKSTQSNETNEEQVFTGCGRRKFVKSSLLGAAAVFGTGSLLKASDNSITAIQNESTTAEKRHKCKITVLRRELYEDLQAEYLAYPKAGKCDLFEEGQEWIVDEENYWKMLNGQSFCSYAWDAVGKFVYAALQGGSLLRGWTKDEKVMIVSCVDGTRPVIFKIERIDE